MEVVPKKIVGAGGRVGIGVNGNFDLLKLCHKTGIGTSGGLTVGSTSGPDWAGVAGGACGGGNGK